MKIILSILLTFCLSYIYNPSYIDSIDVHMEESTCIENKFIKVVNDKISFYFNGNYLFSTVIEDVDYNCVFDFFDYLILDNEINIIFKEGSSIRYLKYNDLGQKIKDKVYSDYSSISKLKFVYDEKNINIVFSTNYSDDEEHLLSNICILKIDEKGNVISVKTYGGYLNEFLIDCYFYDNNLFIFIQRDKMSGGDFNNHGNFVLSIIKDEEIIENVFFKNETFQNIIFGIEKIRISFLDAIYDFDYKLNQILGTEIALESICLISSINKMYMKVFENELIIYDIEENKELYKADLSSYNQFCFLKYFIILEDSIYLCFTDSIKEKYIKIDIFDTRDFVYEVNYLDGISQYNNVIEGWTRNITTEINDESFNPAIDGEYEIVYSFLDYSKIMRVKVLEFQNVSEGGVYPLAYVLKFSGTAFLNGKLINYGYVINNVGEYQLEIYNSSKEKRLINFSVSKNQIYFDSLVRKKSDFVLEKKQNLYLHYFINNIEEYNVEKVIINGENYNKFTFKDNTLTITISESVSGFKYYYIDKIIFKDKDGNLYEEEINEIVSLLILNKEPSVNLNCEENKKQFVMNYTIEDSESVRYLKIYNGSEFIKKVDFKDGNINLKEGSKFKDLSFSLVYELGDGVLYESELFTLLYEGDQIYNIANLNVSKLDNDVKELSISFEKNSNLNKILVEEKELYQKVEEDKGLFYLSIVVLMILLIIRVMYFLNQRKKKNTFEHNNSFKKNEIMI